MLRVAGVGPGNINNLTLEVYEAIKEAKRVLAFGRVGEEIANLREDLIVVTKVKEVLDHYDEDNEEDDLLVLASGDPMFYGITSFLKRKGLEIEKVYPGVSAFQYMMSRLQIPWQDAYLFSVHGRKTDIDKILASPVSIGLVDKDFTPSIISRVLAEEGAKGTITAGSYLSYQGREVIESVEIGEDFPDEDGLSVVVVALDLD